MVDQVEEIKQKTDIVALIGSYIDLKKAGRNYKALCPFHGEKTPSFMVSPELQIYKCFGCGETGDVYSFLQKYEGMEFPEALKFLADKAGVKLEVGLNQANSGNQKLYAINDYAAKFYHYVLLNHKSGGLALDYLTTKRKLKLDTIKKFQLGFSPNHPTALLNFLIGKKKFTKIDLEKSGIVYAHGSRVYDRFRGRVVFPLSDHRGNIVGFAGRILPWDEKRDLAKYINTPETSIYHKSEILYGLNITKKDIKKTDEAVVVEGEIDAISSFQAGVKNVVAIKGSALTEGQARLLSRFTKRIILALDSDSAGNLAAKRGISTSRGVGFEIRVATLDGFKDPDEVAIKAPEKLLPFLEKSEPIWDFLISLVIKGSDPTSGIGKAKISREVMPILAAIEDSIVQAHYVDLVAKKLSVPVDAVEDQLRKLEPSQNESAKSQEPEAKENKSRRDILEEKLLSLAILQFPEILSDKKQTALFQSPFSKKIIDQYIEFAKVSKSYEYSAFVKYLPKELFDRLSGMLIEYDEEYGETLDSRDRLRKEVQALEKELTTTVIKEKLKGLEEKMAVYESEKDSKLLKASRVKFSELTKHLSELEASN